MIGCPFAELGDERRRHVGDAGANLEAGALQLLDEQRRRAMLFESDLGEFPDRFVHGVQFVAARVDVGDGRLLRRPQRLRGRTTNGCEMTITRRETAESELTWRRSIPMCDKLLSDRHTLPPPRSSMKILPVIDLKGGVVVRGVAGRRDEYRPIVSQAVRRCVAGERGPRPA